MRKRRLRPALLAVGLVGVALVGVVAWFVWPKSSAVITAAKEKYARLQLGMSEAEVAAILAATPERDRQLYGEWADASDGRKWIRLTDSPATRKPGPNEKLYNWRAYIFVDGNPSGWSLQWFHIQVYFDEGRLVASAYNEAQDNPVKKGLRELGGRPPRALKFLDVIVDEGRQALPPP
jgi:hypothetical protein